MYNSVGLIQDLLAVLSTTTVLRPSRCAAETAPIGSGEGRVTSCKSESNYKKAGMTVGVTLVIAGGRQPVSRGLSAVL